MHRYSVSATAQSTSAATTKTLIQLITGSTRRAAILEVTIAFKSSTTTDAPALVELLRQTTVGTAGSNPTPILEDPADPPAIATAGINYSAEPTASDILRSWDVPVQGGLVVYQFPLGYEVVMGVSTRLGLRVTTPQAQTGVEARIVWQE